jgi:hypothetical protein|tara:strand:+ start:326 stop:547 length:222 start_codon:yes stop_codon:yes gene_type:complete
MADAQRIKFTIKQDGTVTEEVTGAVGDTCVTLTKELEEKLGKLENRVYNSDYYKSLSTVEDTQEEYTHDSEGC